MALDWVSLSPELNRAQIPSDPDCILMESARKLTELSSSFDWDAHEP